MSTRSMCVEFHTGSNPIGQPHGEQVLHGGHAQDVVYPEDGTISGDAGNAF